MTSFKILQYFPFSYKRRRNRHHRRHPPTNDSNDSSHMNQNHHHHQQQGNNAAASIIIVIDKHGTPVTKCINSAMTAHRSSFLKKPKNKKHQHHQLSSFLLPKFRSSLSSEVAPLHNRFHQLPYELLTHIITWLDLPSILALSYTSKFCHRLCGKSNNDLWYLLYQLAFHTTAAAAAPTTIEDGLSNSYYYYYHLFRDRHLLGKRWQSGKAHSHYLMGHEDSVYCLAWINKHQVLSGSRDRSIKLWDVDRRECLMTQQHHHQGSVLCMAVALDASFFISGSSDATLICWSLPDMVPLRQLNGHLNGVLDVCLVDGWIVSSSRDTTVRVWNRNDGQQQHRLVGHQGPVNALEHIKYTTQVISASGDTTLKLWEVTTAQCLRTFVGHQRGLACVRYDSSLNYLISGGQDGEIKIWDLKSADCLQTMTSHADLIRTIDTFQGTVVSGSYDRTLRVWDASTGKCLLSFHSGHTSWIFNVLVSSTKIISAGQDKKIMILDFGYNLESL